MNKKSKFILFAVSSVLLITAAYFVWNNNSDEEKIRRTLISLASLAEKPDAARPTELAAKLRIIQTVFTDNINLDFRDIRLSGNYSARSLEPMLVNFRKHFADSDCSAGNMDITVSSDRADAVFSCSFSGRTSKGELIKEVRDVNCRLVKIDKTWYIESISINDILER